MYNITKNQLIEFEKKMLELFDEGELPYLLHLSGGNEDALLNIFSNITKGDYIFSTHRNHYHYLLTGGSKIHLEKEIRKGNSMFIFDHELNFYTSSVVAGAACIAAGVAMAIKMKNSLQKVWCFVGDGAEDQGHFYEAVRYVASAKLPCTFIIEDNDKSVNATKEQRNSNELIRWPDCVIRYRYTPIYPHAGTGTGKWVIFKTKETNEF